MKRTLLVLVVLLLSCLGVVAQEDVITKLQVLHPIDFGFNLAQHTEGTTLRLWLVTGYPLVVTHSLGDPPWAVSIYQSQDNDVLEFVAPQVQTGGTKTCCWFDCTTISAGLAPSGFCTRPGACQICEKHCSGGWVNCPAGSTQAFEYVEQ